MKEHATAESQTAAGLGPEALGAMLQLTKRLSTTDVTCDNCKQRRASSVLTERRRGSFTSTTRVLCAVCSRGKQSAPTTSSSIDDATRRRLERQHAINASL